MEAYYIFVIGFLSLISVSQSVTQRKIDLNYKLLTKLFSSKLKEVVSDETYKLIVNGDEIEAIKSINKELGLSQKESKNLMRAIRKDINFSVN